MAEMIAFWSRGAASGSGTVETWIASIDEHYYRVDIWAHDGPEAIPLKSYVRGAVRYAEAPSGPGRLATQDTARTAAILTRMKDAVAGWSYRIIRGAGGALRVARHQDYPREGEDWLRGVPPLKLAAAKDLCAGEVTP